MYWIQTHQISQLYNHFSKSQYCCYCPFPFSFYCSRIVLLLLLGTARYPKSHVCWDNCPQVFLRPTKEGHWRVCLLWLHNSFKSALTIVAQLMIVIAVLLSLPSFWVNRARCVAHLSANHYYYNHVSHDIIYGKVGELNFPCNDTLADGQTKKNKRE